MFNQLFRMGKCVSVCKGYNKILRCMLFWSLRHLYTSRVKDMLLLLPDLGHRSGKQNRLKILPTWASSVNCQSRINNKLEETNQLVWNTNPNKFVPIPNFLWEKSAMYRKMGVLPQTHYCTGLSASMNNPEAIYF